VFKADLLELAKRTKDLWHKIEGLYLAAAIASVIYWAFALLLHGILKGDIRLWVTSAGSTAYYLLALATNCLIILIIRHFWKKQRSTPTMPKEKPSILFAIDTEADSKDHVKRLYNRFQKELKKRGLEEVIHYEIHNNEQARSYLQDTGATIVIFGEYNAGFKGSKKTEQFQSLSFHWSGNTPIDLDDQVMAAAMEEFPFKVEDSESLTQIPKAQFEFANIVLFSVALSLTSIGKSQQARALWTDLIQKETFIRNKSQRFSLYTKWWARNEFAYAHYLYVKDVKNNLTKPNFQDAGLTILQILEEIEKHLRDHPHYYMLKAICEFHTGSLKQAKLTTERGLKRFKRIDFLACSFNLSLGFIASWRKLYDRALKHYRSTTNITRPPEDNDQIVSFIRTVIQNNPQRVDLDFCLSFILDHHCNGNAEIMYEDFLDRSAGIMEIDAFRDYATLRLEKIGTKNRENAKYKDSLDRYTQTRQAALKP
jgi:hypothetical protein